MKTLTHNDEQKNINKCKAHHHFTFPWLLDYRCGHCFQYFGENLKNISYIKCPKCGYVNDIIDSTSMLGIDEYPKLIKTVENDIEEMKKNKR